MIVLGVITLIGGIHAIQPRRWGLALAGSILSVSGVATFWYTSYHIRVAREEGISLIGGRI